MSKIQKRPDLSDKAVEAFINAAPDATRAPAPVPEAKSSAVGVPISGGRKKPISLTIDSKLLQNLDKKAANLGISRAAAFALAVSRFIAAEEREANR